MRKTAIKFGPCYNAVGTSRPSQISYCERVAEKALLSIDQRDFRSIKLGSDKGGKNRFYRLWLLAFYCAIEKRKLDCGVSSQWLRYHTLISWGSVYFGLLCITRENEGKKIYRFRSELESNVENSWCKDIWPFYTFLCVN